MVTGNALPADRAQTRLFDSHSILDIPGSENRGHHMPPWLDIMASYYGFVILWGHSRREIELSGEML